MKKALQIMGIIALAMVILYFGICVFGGIALAAMMM